MTTSPRYQPWLSLLGPGDFATIERGKFGNRVGAGSRPAIIAIDVQNYMVGPPAGSTHEYPSACATGMPAVEAIEGLLAGARDADIPVFYTRMSFARDGSDIGVYGRKRDLMQTEGWCLAGSEGAQIVDRLAPHEGEIVLDKRKPSAFLGTPLLPYLIDRGIDTLVLVGGSTSNCVRATAVDASSYNFRTLIVGDCVFDRFEISHLTALFDLDRQYGDVVESAELIADWKAMSR